MSENDMSPMKLGSALRKRARSGSQSSPFLNNSGFASPNYHLLRDSQPQSSGPAYKFSQMSPLKGSPIVLSAFALPAAQTGYQTPPTMRSPPKSNYHTPTSNGTPKNKHAKYHVIAANGISMVVQPPIDFEVKASYVGKLFSNHDMYHHEQEICKVLSTLDPQQEYLVYGDPSIEHSIPVTSRVLSELTMKHTDFKYGIEKYIRSRKIDKSAYPVYEMVMPYGGVSMKTISPLRPVAMSELIKYGIDMLYGVMLLQQKRYVHQDILAKNVLIDHGRARLADFGTVLSYDEVFTSKNDRLQDFSLAHPPEYFVNHFQTYYNNVASDRKQFMKLHGFANKQQFQEAFIEATSHEKVHAYPQKVDVYSVGMILFVLLQKEDHVMIESNDKINSFKTVIKRMTTLHPKKRLTAHMAVQMLKKLLPTEKAIQSPTSPSLRSPVASPYKSIMTARTES